MKNLQKANMYSLKFNIGIVSMIGHQAGEYFRTAHELLNKKVTNDSWADIMVNLENGKVYAMWAGELTGQAECCYAELDESDCPSIFEQVKKKYFANN